MNTDKIKKLRKLFTKILFIFLYVYFFFTSKFFFYANVILLAIFIFFYMKLLLNNMFLTKNMTLYNTHVFGKKGRGKDLQTQLVIYRRYAKKYNKTVKRLKKDGLNDDEIENYFKEKPNYLSNIDYGYGARVIDLKELELIDENTKKSITFDDIITGKYKSMKIIKKDMFEGLDVFISDAQLGLPNTEHNTLDKIYPWLPVFIALSRQLYNMNVVVNTQEYNRLWIKLRGQQDVYFKALDTMPVNKSFLQKIWFKIPILKKYIFMKIRFFEEQQSAENNILPFSAKGLSNEGLKNVYLTSGQATKEQFDATHGKIRDLLCFINIKHIKYDTRIFHEYIFGYKYESDNSRK